MPKSLKAVVFLQVVAEVTTGKHANTIVSEIKAMDVVKRYYDDNGI